MGDPNRLRGEDIAAADGERRSKSFRELQEVVARIRRRYRLRAEWELELPLSEALRVGDVVDFGGDVGEMVVTSVESTRSGDLWTVELREPPAR